MTQYQIIGTRLAQKTKYLARILLKEGYDQEKLIDRMLEIGTSFNRGDIASVRNLSKPGSSGCAAKATL